MEESSATFYFKDNKAGEPSAWVCNKGKAAECRQELMKMREIQSCAGHGVQQRWTPRKTIRR